MSTGLDVMIFGGGVEGLAVLDSLTGNISSTSCAARPDSHCAIERSGLSRFGG